MEGSIPGFWEIELCVCKEIKNANAWNRDSPPPPQEFKGPPRIFMGLGRMYAHVTYYYLELCVMVLECCWAYGMMYLEARAILCG